MNKESFIKLLQDKSIDAEENLKELNQIIKMGTIDFVPFLDNDFKSKNYFDEKLFDIQLYKLKMEEFSLERVKYFIEIKKELQQMNVNGFDILHIINDESTDSSFIEFKLPKVNVQDYSPSSRIKEAIELNDIEKLRIVLITDLNNNLLSIEELIKSIVYSSEKIALFEVYATNDVIRPIENDSSHWNAKYFDIYTIYLEKNFSAERLFNLLNVKEYLRKNKVDGFKQIHKTETPKQSTISTCPNNLQNSKPDWVKKALMIGGVAAAVLLGLLCMFRR